MAITNPMSMKLSATWEIEKSSPSVVPRLCSLTITEVSINKSAESEAHSTFVIAVRMRDSARRVLRSPEILLADGVGTVSLDLSCSIQYSHMLKRDSNILQILVQRRKKYKSKTMNLGYKTLAYCNIDLAQVLQRRMENRYLELFADPKSVSSVIGRIEIQALSTLPVDKINLYNGRRKDLEEEDEGMQDPYSEQEDSDHGEDSDFEPMCEDDGQSRQKKIMKAMSVGVQGRRRPSSPTTVVPEWQKQIKQKIVSLLKKMKFMDPNQELDPTTTSQLWDDIDQLETVSDADSDMDMDTLSVQSTPRPTLRPFFGHAGSSEDTLNANTGAKLAKNMQRSSAIERMPGNLHQGGPTSDPSSTPGHYSASIPISGASQQHTGDLQHSTFEESSEENSHSNDSGGGGGGGLTPLPGSKPRSHHRNQDSADTQAKSGKSSSRERSISLREKKEKSKSGGALTGAGGGTMANANATAGQAANQGANAAQTKAENRISMNEQLPVDRRRSSSIPDTRGSMETCGPVRLLHICPLPSMEPRRETVEQVSKHVDSEECLPTVLYLVNVAEQSGKALGDALLKSQQKVVTIGSYTDARFAVTHLVNKVQKQSRLSNLIKVCLLGGDHHVNAVLRVYVEQLSSKSSEMMASFRFFLVPLPCGPTSAGQKEPVAGIPSQPGAGAGVLSSSLSASWGTGACTNMLARQLCQLDPQYAALFGDIARATGLKGMETMPAPGELTQRIQNYVGSAQNVVQFPIGECLVASKSKSSGKGPDDDTGEVFVPFVSGVRLGEVYDSSPGGGWSHTSTDQEDIPVQIGTVGERSSTHNTPPHSPNLSSPTVAHSQSSAFSGISGTPGGGKEQSVTSAGQGSQMNTPKNEAASASSAGGQGDPVLDLQIEYWLEGADRKFNLRSVSRGVTVTLTPPSVMYGGSGVCQGGQATSLEGTLLNMVVVSKEKKQKIMRIGKKYKDGECKREVVDNISRLICTSKSQGSPMRVTIDGYEWPGIKFFQLSPFWRTHVKLLPVATFASAGFVAALK